MGGLITTDIRFVNVDVQYLENYDMKKWGPLKQEKEGDVGFDLHAAIDRFIPLWPEQRCVVPNGIKLAIPKGHGGFIMPRSGLAKKHGITVLNTPGTIDPGYRGEVCTILYNSGRDMFEIDIGMRISQLQIHIIPFVELISVSQLADSERGSGGFGHTG